MINVRTLNWFSKYANFDQCNFANENDKTNLSEQVIPYYSQQQNHYLWKKQTHTFVPRTSAAVGISLSFISQLQSLEFFQSPEWDVRRNSTRLSNRFLFNSSCSRYKENTKLHKLFLAVICYIFPNLRKKTIIISIPKITCKMIIRWNLNFFSLNIQWISSVWDSFL